MINKQLTYLLLLIGLIALSLGCKKKDLPHIPYENNPVFNIEGTINNETVDLHAGENNAFMISKVEKLNGINQFTGRLNDGSTSMSIHMFNSNVDIPTLLGNFIELENYTIAEHYGNSSLLEITKNDFANASTIDYIVWTVNGAQQSNSTLAIYEPGRYTICAKAHFFNGSEATTCNSISVGYKSNTDFVLNWEIQQNQTVNAFINTSESTVESIKWYIDDVFIADEITLNQSNIPNKFHLKAEVRFQNGVVAKREVFINKTTNEYSIEDFVLIGHKSPLEWDTSVQFTVVKNGITYQSINGASSNSTFSVNDISDYKSTADGSEAKVKLVKGTLDCSFLNTSSGGVVNGTFQIEIGVGY